MKASRNWGSVCLLMAVLVTCTTLAKLLSRGWGLLAGAGGSGGFWLLSRSTRTARCGERMAAMAFRGVVVAALAVSVSFAADAGPVALAQPCEACQQFNRLNILIRDRKIPRAAARQQLQQLLPAIRDYARRRGAAEYRRAAWVFPLAGMTTKRAGNSRGSDYVRSDYDYFDGNAHGGHPSFDLFIRDRNQDSLEDGSGAPVSVLSMTGGIVVASENQWDRASKLRGGKYLWIYDYSSEALVYYAHNRDVFVRVGDLVKPGDVIATVGRTGLNAARKRSPTHLHLTFLKIIDGYPRPENVFADLTRAHTAAR